MILFKAATLTLLYSKFSTKLEELNLQTRTSKFNGAVDKYSVSHSSTQRTAYETHCEIDNFLL